MFLKTGNIFRSVSGWISAALAAPSIVVAVIAFLEGFTWSEIIVGVLLALAASAVLIYVGIRIFEAISGYSIQGAERKRIKGDLELLKSSGIQDIIAGHASGVWAGTYDNTNINWRIKHLALKGAIKRGE